MLRTRALSGCSEFFLLDGYIYRIAAILGISRAFVLTTRRKALALRRACLPLVVD